MNWKPEDRVDKIVSDLLRGRRLKLRGADAEEKGAITTAARLAAARTGPQRMSPAFRRRLASALALTPNQTFLTRRNALVAGLGLAAGAVAGSLIGRALEPQPYATPAPAADRSGVINPRDGRWIDVAAMADLVEGEGKRVTAGGIGAYLFRQGDSVTAVSSICTHLPCELLWDGANHVLLCSCHPASFTPDGRTTSKTYPLPTLHPVQVRVTSAGRVEVFGTA